MTFAAHPQQTRRFTAEEVMRMVSLGVIHDDERIELIEGQLIVVSPQGPLHSGLAVKLRRRLEQAYGSGYHVRDHSPVFGTEDSIPEPDLAVVRGEPDGFLSRLPGPGDCPLVVELALSSVSIDRHKARVYAAAGYTHYILVDVQARRLEVRAGSTKDAQYERIDVLGEGAFLALPETSERVAVTDFLAPEQTSE